MIFPKEGTHPKYSMANSDALLGDATYDRAVFLGDFVHQLGKIVTSFFEFFSEVRIWRRLPPKSKLGLVERPFFLSFACSWRRRNPIRFSVEEPIVLRNLESASAE